MNRSPEETLLAAIRDLRDRIQTSAGEAREQLSASLDAIEQAHHALYTEDLRDPVHREVPEPMRSFFTPALAAPVPAWIPDHMTRRQLDTQRLFCPEGAQIVEDDDELGCAILQGLGRPPLRHGLSLRFYRAGTLQSQRLYVRGRLRWAINYHLTGGRASCGFYLDQEPLSNLEDGLHTSYAPNGVIVAQSSWSRGRLQGWSKLWEDSGYPICAIRYEAGTPTEEVFSDGERRALSLD